MSNNKEVVVAFGNDVVEVGAEVSPVEVCETVAAELEIEPVAEPEPEPEIEPVAEPDTIGVVSDCTHLNIRKGANKSATIVTVIPAKTEVKIDLKKSNRDWYKVCTAFGIEGFCMKEYITIKQ